MLAGPGTGKTTTLVEAIVDRIERRGADPSQVLALTFSRKAAEQLRDRVTARLGRTTGIGDVLDHPLLRLRPDPPLRPARALPRAAAAAVRARAGRRAPRAAAPYARVGALARRARPRARDPRLRARGADGAVPRPREGHGGPTTSSPSASARQVPAYVAAGLFLEHYLDNLDDQSATDYADLIRRAVIEATAHRDELRRQFRHVFVDEYQDTDPGQVALLRALAGDGGDLVVVGDPHQSIYGFRGAEVRGILEFPADFPRADGYAGPGGLAANDAALRPAAARRHPARRRPHRAPGRHRRRGSRGVPPPRGGDEGRGDDGLVTCAPSTPSAPRPSTSPTCSAAPTSRTASPWDRMAVLVRSGRASIPPLRRALGAAGVPVEVARDDLPLVQDPSVLPLLDALRARGQHRQRRRRVRRLRRPRPRRVAAARARSAASTRATYAASSRLLRTREKDAAHAEAPAAAHLARAGPARGAARRLPRRRHRPGGGRRPGAAHAAPRRPPTAWPPAAPPRTPSVALWSGTGWPGRLRRGGRVRRGSGPARPPRPRLGGGAVRGGRPRGREARRRRGLRSGRCPRLPRAPGRPADPRRHAGRAGRPGRGGPAADRPPVQGPRVGPRRRRPRPAGRLARPPPPLDDAPGRPDRCRPPRAGRARPGR